MKKVFRGRCLTRIPHPSLKQFDEQQLISTFFNRKNERGGALDKWFYFYCNPVLDPVVIEVDHRGPHLHPGLKRFIGTALRSEQLLPAWIVTDQEQPQAQGIDCFETAYTGSDWQQWILDQKTLEFTNEQIQKWIRETVLYRWHLELPSGDVFVLNPYAQQIAETYRVADLGLLGALQQMYQDCCKKTTVPALQKIG